MTNCNDFLSEREKVRYTTNNGTAEFTNEVDEGGGRLTGTRASEAKGPFPGGKRVGSWGKRKEKRKKEKEKVKEK